MLAHQGPLSCWSRMLFPPSPETKTKLRPSSAGVLGSSRERASVVAVLATVWSWQLLRRYVREYECSWAVAMIAPPRRDCSYTPQPVSSPFPPTCINCMSLCQLLIRQVELSAASSFATKRS